MIRLRGMDLSTSVRAAMAGWGSLPCPTHVFLCVADHFEPDWNSASPSVQRDRVARWVSEYQRSVDPFVDSRGRPPQHTFFYPMECYRAELVEQLAGIARSGYGDIEIHLHHDNDSAHRLRTFLWESAERLRDRHGLLTTDAGGRIRYGFIHGNWALDNSRPDGRWCGVNNELTVLRETGCYADFTMPAAPSPAQTRMINRIYYALDNPELPKSHDTGIPAAVSMAPVPKALLMIQGPLLIRQQHFWTKPRLENGNLSSSQPPTADRLADWLRARVSVQGHGRWNFIKLHTHGAQEANAAMLLGQPMRRLHEKLQELSTRRDFKFYYVTAREMAQLVRQAEQGRSAPDFNQLGWDT